MAHIQHKYCSGCENDYSLYINGKCSDCLSREKRQAMAAWNAQTHDEKLLDLHKRLLEVESNGNITY